jgi:phage terminase small subunit
MWHYRDIMVHRAVAVMALTIKQEKFAQLVVELGDNSKAYRGAYDASRMKPESVHRKARELIENVKVAARIDELREELAQRGRCTLDSLLLELEETRVSALNRETPQCGAAVAATMGKAKLCGLDKQLVELSGTITTRSTLADFYDDESDA